MSTIRSRVWRDGVEVARDFPLADLDAHLADPTTLVWLDLADPTADLLARLAEELQLDPIAVEDAVAPGERPKATRHRTHTFFTVYGATLGELDGRADVESRLGLSRVSGFVRQGGLVTVRRGAFDMDPVLRRWEEDRSLLAEGVDALVHGLLDVVVDGHFDTIQRMDDAIEELEDQLFDDAAGTRAVQQRIYRVRKELVQLRRVVLPMREVVNAVMRHRTSYEEDQMPLAAPIHELDGAYQDLYDHVLRAAEWTESLRDMVTTLFETNLSLQDARLNTVMKKLAAWAAIIAVPTAITGWFGMNVPYPGFSERLGFWLCVGLLVVSTGSLYAVFKRRDWL